MTDFVCGFSYSRKIHFYDPTRHPCMADLLEEAKSIFYETHVLSNEDLAIMRQQERGRRSMAPPRLRLSAMVSEE